MLEHTVARTKGMTEMQQGVGQLEGVEVEATVRHPLQR